MEALGRAIAESDGQTHAEVPHAEMKALASPHRWPRAISMLSLPVSRA